MKSKILALALKELQTLPKKDQEYFGKWMMGRVDALLAFRRKNGRYPEVQKPILTNELRVFIENLRIKHGMRNIQF